MGRTWENWVWQPYNVDRCSVFVEEVYGANLCSVSSRPCARENLYQTILFVGDSLTFQMYASLVLQYGSSKEAADEKQQMNSEGFVVSSLCDGLYKAKYIRNDYLTEAACEHCQDFWSHMTTADILVLNRGAHILSNAETTAQMSHFTSRLLSLQEAKPCQGYSGETQYLDTKDVTIYFNQASPTIEQKLQVNTTGT